MFWADYQFLGDSEACLMNEQYFLGGKKAKTLMEL